MARKKNRPQLTAHRGGYTQAARFWTWLNDGWVRVTLYPGESLSWSHGERTDEGYSCHGETFAYDERTGDIANEYTAWGRDCDGPYQSGAARHCHLSQLTADEPDPGIMAPAWQRGHAWQRDAYAEAAGY